MDYPYLTSFADNYLHQDSDMYGPVPAGAFLTYLRECELIDLEHVREELDHAIRTHEANELDAFARGISEGWGWSISGRDLIELQSMALAYDPVTCEVRMAERARQSRQSELEDAFPTAFPGCTTRPAGAPTRTTYIADPGLIDDMAAWCTERGVKLHAELFVRRDGAWTPVSGAAAVNSPTRTTADHNVEVANVIRRAADRAAGSTMEVRLWFWV